MLAELRAFTDPIKPFLRSEGQEANVVANAVLHAFSEAERGITAWTAEEALAELHGALDAARPIRAAPFAESSGFDTAVYKDCVDHAFFTLMLRVLLLLVPLAGLAFALLGSALAMAMAMLGLLGLLAIAMLAIAMMVELYTIELRQCRRQAEG